MRRSFALAALALGCAPAAPPPPRCPEAPAPKPAPTASAAPAEAPSPSLTITLTPDPRVARVAVEIVARGAPAALAAWSLASPDPGAFALEGARDDRGPLAAHPLTSAAEGAPLRIVLDRPAVGAVHLLYSLASRPRPRGGKTTIDLDPNHFEAAGEALLALPDAFEETPIPTSIHLEHPYWEDAVGASSFGFGASREVTASGRSLRFATFLVGTIGRALFDTHEGHDEAAWLGYTSFDPRPVSADIAAFRTAVRELFHDSTGGPLTLLLVADLRAAGAFQVTRRASSVLAHVGVSEPWSGPVRIAVATEVIHGWIGSRLWVGPSEPSREAEAYWFTEGLARGLARDLLFRFGLLTATELLDELHGLAAMRVTSPRRAEGNEALAAHAKDAGVVPLLIARGALYTARVEAALRKKSAGQRGLESVLRGLFAQAQEARGPLPTSAWIEALTAALDASEAAAFTQAIAKGTPVDLPEGALGPCFQGTTRTYAAFDLGFDDDATHDSASHEVAGLRASGPAAKAGLREGDVVVDEVVSRGRSDVRVKLTVERDGKPLTIGYLPAGATAKGQGWLRKRDVSDDACTK